MQLFPFIVSVNAQCLLYVMLHIGEDNNYQILGFKETRNSLYLKSSYAECLFVLSYYLCSAIGRI